MTMAKTVKPRAKAARAREQASQTLADLAAGAQAERARSVRARTMRAVKSRDTGPEKQIRALLRAFAPGYRLHRRDLPGSPDIAYVGRKCAIFVHGCFWHGHDCPRGARAPKTNVEYWTRKIARNRARDEAALNGLDALGWRALVAWECELKTPELAARLRRFVCGEVDILDRD
jgi:DNA mismatch endonuclease (patch repair protein)